MKLCIIGNSHIASLKLAWDKSLHKEYPKIQLTFFGARGGMLFYLRPSQRKLVSINEGLSKSLRFTSGGQEVIDPDLFDAFLIYGCDSNVQDMLALEKGDFSASVKQATFEEFWQNRAALKLAIKLRAITGKPIFFGLQPLPANRVPLNLPTDAYADFCDMSDTSVFQPLAVKLVPQPKQTIVNGDGTAPNLTKGSDLLQADAEMAGMKHESADTNHMNADYGAIWLRGFIARYL